MLSPGTRREQPSSSAALGKTATVPGLSARRQRRASGASVALARPPESETARYRATYPRAPIPTVCCLRGIVPKQRSAGASARWSLVRTTARRRSSSTRSLAIPRGNGARSPSCLNARPVMTLTIRNGLGSNTCPMASLIRTQAADKRGSHQVEDSP